MSAPVLYFDGVCNLCNAAVQFVIRHDREGKIRFASLQSAAGAEAIKKVETRYRRRPDSLLFEVGDKIWIESDAALQVARYLDGAWKALSTLRIFPRFLRDFAYRLIARNRYRWFGKKDACTIPTPELKTRFIGA
jgi:predicted DCC family thiol-disulfide oxidoreductase YuxK